MSWTKPTADELRREVEEEAALRLEITKALYDEDDKEN